MPQLTIYNFTTPDPMNAVANQIMAQLRTVKDDSMQDINQSVEFGLDSALWDVMYGGRDSNDSQFPMIRVWYGTIKRETDDGLMGIMDAEVPMYLYFLYYVGVPSTDPVRVSFVEARENHIRYNLEALRMDRLIPATDGTGRDTWRFVVQDIVEDHDTPFKYIDSTIQLPPQWACTRVDVTFQCKGTIAPIITQNEMYGFSSNQTPTADNFYGLNSDMSGGTPTAAGAGTPVPRAGTFKNAYLSCTGSLTFINTTWTLYKSTDGGQTFTATAITMSAVISYTASDTTHTVTANAGDCFLWKCDAATAVNQISIGIDFQ